MAATKEAIFICLDVGPSMRQKFGGDDDKSPLDTALECISWILQRRIFTESKDEIGMVLFGTTETANPLAEDGQYENISVVRDLQMVDWDLVKTVDNIPRDSVDADFIDALVVAMDALRSGTEGKKFAQKSIVMFSNLCSEFADDQIDPIINSMKDGAIDFAAIGPSIDDDENEENKDGAANAFVKSKKKTAQQRTGEKVMKKIVESVDGTCMSLNEALPCLSFFSRRQVKPTAWKCNLEIGTDLRIPLCLYLKTRENKLKQTWKWMNAQDASAEINMARTFHKKDENEDEADEQQTKKETVNGKDGENEENDEEDKDKLAGDEVDKEEIVKAYKYGTTLVPLDKLDLDSVKYKSESKSFQVLGFTSQNNIKRHYFMADGVHVALADANDPTACVAFSAFIKALLETKMAGLVRYCYSARSSPRIGALIPEVDDKIGHEYLIYVSLPYSEDCRLFSFPTLNNDRIKPTDDQNEAIDSLIQSMDLTRAKLESDGKRVEAFNPEDVINPQTQYVFQCLQQRVLSPNEPLPEPSPQLLSIISPLTERLNLAKPAVEMIKNRFKLEKVEKKDTKRTAAEVFKANDEGPPEKITKTEETDANAEPLEAELVVKISTVRPVEDFLAAVEKNEKCFDLASEKLFVIVKQFVIDGVGSQLYEKALQCLETIRQKSVQLNLPGRFNRFISTFKVILLEKGKEDFWKEICKKNLGLICDEETPSSQVKKSEADEFLKDDEKKNESFVKADVQEAEENLLDELE